MFYLANIIDWIRKISDMDFYKVAEFIFFIGSILGTVKFVAKRVKGNLHTIKGASLIILILLIGLVLPTLRLLLWDWKDTIDIILNCLAILCLLNFLFLLIIIWQMNLFAKKKTGKATTEEATIKIRGTYQFFNGDIQIFLAEQNFYGNPLGHKITAKVWSPNYDEIGIKNQGVGFSLKYASKNEYRIRITKAEINEATFQVTKL